MAGTGMSPGQVFPSAPEESCRRASEGGNTGQEVRF